MSYLLEIIHIDLCAPTRTCGINGKMYFMLLIDEYSRMTWVTFFREKYEAFKIFKVLKSMLENQIYAKIKCLRSDRGGEFTSN